jgi:hypothetical protein
MLTSGDALRSDYTARAFCPSFFMGGSAWGSQTPSSNITKSAEGYLEATRY